MNSMTTTNPLEEDMMKIILLVTILKLKLTISKEMMILTGNKGLEIVLLKGIYNQEIHMTTMTDTLSTELIMFPGNTGQIQMTNI